MSANDSTFDWQTLYLQKEDMSVVQYFVMRKQITPIDANLSHTVFSIVATVELQIYKSNESASIFFFLLLFFSQSIVNGAGKINITEKRMSSEFSEN